MAFKMCQSRLNFLPNPQKSPNMSNILPKWRNFAKSGHNAARAIEAPLNYSAKTLHNTLRKGLS